MQQCSVIVLQGMKSYAYIIPASVVRDMKFKFGIVNKQYRHWYALNKTSCTLYTS